MVRGGKRRTVWSGWRCGSLDVLEHHYGVSAAGNGRAGHDLPDCAARKRAGGRVAGAGGACNGERTMHGGFGGPAGVAIARRAGKGRLIAIGAEGFCKDASRRGAEGYALGGGRSWRRRAA